MFQTENERDYSGTMSSIPIEPLLTIVKNNETETSRDISNAIADHNTLNDKMKTRISRSSDSGYPNSPTLGDRSTSFRSDSSDIVNGLASFPRTKGKLKNEQIPLSNLECAGSGRSQSFNSSADTINSGRDVSPSIHPRSISGRFIESESASGHFVATTKVRRISRGSNGSVENPASKLSSTNTVSARHVAMKMLAASSRSYKLQEELAKPQILKLLLDCLDDRDDEIILQSAETLANIAMNIETHLQLKVENVEEGLFKLLRHNKMKVQYQAARGLVYLGHLDVNGKYIYNYITCGECGSNAVYMEEEGRSHIRGTTVEHLILTLTTTKDIYLLWGGAHNLPPSPNQRKNNSRHPSSKSRSKFVPSENQIVNFILSIYQTFVHPIIFMRLLLHRFREPTAYSAFTSIEEDIHAPMEHYAPLPIVHARLMRVWIGWLENHADDFVTFPVLRDELSVLIGPMRSIDGPYTPCANKIDQLLMKSAERSSDINVYNFESESHHNILYERCYKAIKEGKLPCSEDDYVYLAALQMYIEDICLYGQDFAQRLKTIESITMSRLKQNFGSSILSSKHLLKRTKAQYEDFLSEQPTERNAKHNFVDCCQSMSGYGCTFFKVKQRIPNSRSRKKVYITRFFGISARRIVILDDRTKVCVEKFNPRHLYRTEPLEDSLTIKINFRTKNNDKTIEMQLENRLVFKELSNNILTCRMELNFQGYQNIDNNPWSLLAEELGTWGNMALQLHTNKNKVDHFEELSPEERKRGRSTTTTAFPMTG